MNNNTVFGRVTGNIAGILWGILVVLVILLYLPWFRRDFPGIQLLIFWGSSSIAVQWAGFVYFHRGKARSNWGDCFIFLNYCLLVFACGQLFFKPLGIEYYPFYFLMVVLAGFIASRRVSILVGPFLLFLETTGYGVDHFLWDLSAGGFPTGLLMLWVSILPLSLLLNIFVYVKDKSNHQIYQNLLKNGNTQMPRDSRMLLDLFSERGDMGNEEILRQEFERGERRRDHYIQGVLGFLSRIVKSYSCLFFQLDKQTGKLELRDFVSTAPRLINGHSVPVGQGAIGWVASGDLLSLHLRNRMECEGKVSYYRKDPGIASMMVVPVRNENSLEGAICIDSRVESAFNPDSEKLLKIAGELVAFVLQSIRSGEFLLEEREKVKNLSEASRRLAGTLSLREIYDFVPQLLQNLVNCDLAFIAARVSSGNLRIMNAWGASSELVTGLEESSTASLVGWAVNTVKTDIFLTDAKNLLDEMPLFSVQEPRLEIHSLGIIPLLIQDTAIGALVVAGRDLGMLSAVTQDLLIAFGLQVSTSLDNANMYEEMEKTAVTDGLTKIYNHRYFQERLESEYIRTKRTNDPLSLLLIDIDHFKKCNDTYGHPMGDFILSEVASLMGKEVRDVDLAARYGGEEFVILLVNTGLSGAQIFAERLRKKVAKKRFKKGDLQVKITISIGISAIPENASTSNELIAQADQALYQAKHSGRNQCCIFEHEQESVPA